jgi:hypothetical protein
MVPWGTLMTGAVGLAGIGGTFWQGKRAREAASRDLRESLDTGTRNLLTSISAENERVRIAEKRRIYATCQASFENILQPVMAHRGIADSPSSEERGAVAAAVLAAETAMSAALSELKLIAPGRVGRVADDVASWIRGYMRATLHGARRPFSESESAEEYGALRYQLYIAMRADLGEVSTSPENT